MVLVVLAAAAGACGRSDDDHPPPTIGDATVVERPDPGVTTTATVP